MNKKFTSTDMIAKFKQLGIENEVEFYFVPSAKLKQLIIQGGDPIVDKLPQLSRKCILELPDGKGLPQYTPMVLKYLDGTLDDNNKYILDMGELRVQNEGELMLKALNKSNKMRHNL